MLRQIVLRQIVLLSLAMTAYDTLLPTKANAATLTFTDPGSNQIEGVVPEPSLRSRSPDPPRPPRPSSPPGSGRPPLPPPPPVPPLPPLPDPFPDPLEPLFPPIDPPKLPPGGGGYPDKPVLMPEPVTIFGTATALGWGVLLKRKSSKRKKS